MSAASPDAHLTEIIEEAIPALAKLYDRFANALDPFSEQRDSAEKVFMKEVASWYDSLELPKPTFQEFRKAVILRCKRHLAASDKPASI